MLDSRHGKSIGVDRDFVVNIGLAQTDYFILGSNGTWQEGNKGEISRTYSSY